MVLTNPYAVFARAQNYWAAARYPRQIAYNVVVRVSIRGTISVAHYHSFWDSAEDRVYVDGVSDEARAHPYTPHGIKTALNLIAVSIPMSTAEFTGNYLGVPHLAPNYSFGIAQYVAEDSPDSQALVTQIRQEFKEGAKPIITPTPAPGTLKTIVSLEVRPRDYVIALHGMANVDGHTDYHLLLRPLRDPSQYRLREAWINAQSFGTDRLVNEGNFYAGPGNAGRVPWHIDFEQRAGSPYIVSESTDAKLTIERRTYNGASVLFQDYRTAKIPAYASLWSSTGPLLTEPVETP